MKKEIQLGYKIISMLDEQNEEILNKEAECIVVFIDILGFKELIKDSNRLVFIFRAIEKITNDYYTLARDLKGRKKTRQDINKENSKVFSFAKKLHDSILDKETELPKYQIFSDSIIITRPLII